MEQGIADLTKAIRDSLWSATERHGGAGPSSGALEGNNRGAAASIALGIEANAPSQKLEENVELQESVKLAKLGKQQTPSGTTPLIKLCAKFSCSKDCS
ncbi:hypothetical protein LWI29_020500 [Acer saccharum]|uniref:Uncharacterized protein n=1 Tax=Acer saccharum TaxID=4024 RepID=A0AA39RLX6_ACESA|nr:hypothetical protein LWI29_020500 [Acer saccharum]